MDTPTRRVAHGARTWRIILAQRSLGVVLSIVVLALVAACSNGPDGPVIADATPWGTLDARDPRCDPFKQHACMRGERCTFSWETVEPVSGEFGCWSTGAIEPGDPCDLSRFGKVGECVAGAACFPTGAGEMRCSVICRVNPGGEPCGAGVCTAVDGLGGDDDGVCVVELVDAGS